MLRMKIFAKVYINELECAVNDWLRENARTIEITEVHYSTSVDEYSVIIFYKSL